MHLAARLPAAIAISLIALLPAPAADTQSIPQAVPVAARADYFQFPLPTWSKHCLGFGSQWRLCDGTPLRTCPSTGAVWLHTGFDVTTGIQPVRAAANGVIVGYLVDPTFKGGVLIRHQTATGIVITQYWHVWPRPGFSVGTPVSRGQVFADVANMGSRTHLHFAVFRGDMQSVAWRGALPPAPCAGDPAFPYHFVDPTLFVLANQMPAPPVRIKGHCHLDGEP